MLHFILWIIGLIWFFSSGFGLICLYLALRLLASPIFWCIVYLLYIWATKK